MSPRILAPALAAMALVLAATAASGETEPFDPRGVLLEGKEKIPGFPGRLPAAFHLGADGTAAATLVDPFALAIGWTGTWTFDGTTLDLDLDAETPGGDPIQASLVVKPSGAAKGTIRRLGTEEVVSSVSLKRTWPPRRAAGWTAVLPRLRDGAGSTAAGEFRGTLLLADLRPAGRKKPKPQRVAIRAVSPEGLPGLPRSVDLFPGQVRRISGAGLPSLPVGKESETLQVEVAGGKGFGPATVHVGAVEEVLRGPFDPATSGSPVPVRWAKALSKKERAARDAASLVAPRFLDDGGAGVLPRETVVVLRDLSPFTGDPSPGSVRVSVRTLGGVEVASADVPLLPGAAVEVRPRDLLGNPADLPGGEGQVRVTAADGSPLARGIVGAAACSTVRRSGAPVASIYTTLEHPEPAGRLALLAVPYLYAPDDGSGTARVSVLNLGTASEDVDVLVLALDGTPLLATFATIPAGGTARVDPEALGMDLALLPGGEAQVLLGGSAGLAVEGFVADGEGRVVGDPDSFFPGPVGFEQPLPATEGPVRVILPDALETGGSDLGDRDAWLFVRNGGAAGLDVVARAVDENGAAAGAEGAGVPLTVPAGASLRVWLEEVLALLGVPLDPGAGSFRGTLVLEIPEPAGAGPLRVLGLQLRRSGTALGGYVAPTVVR